MKSEIPCPTSPRPQQAEYHGLVVIEHPLGLFMRFRADAPNASKLLQFGAQCIRDLENEHAVQEWSI